MDKYIAARFGYLEAYTLAELEKEEFELREELYNMNKAIKEGNCSSEQKSEFENDIKYGEEKLEYIKFLIVEMSGRCKTK